MEVDSSSSMENDRDSSSSSTTTTTSTTATTNHNSTTSSTTTSSSLMDKDGEPQQRPPSPVAGPRCAPTYSVVNAIIEKKEDGPGPRCGHTLTAVPAVGEEGTPGYIGPRLILFGGATALEGNSAAAGTPSSAGSAGISLYTFPAFLLSQDLIWVISLFSFCMIDAGPRRKP